MPVELSRTALTVVAVGGFESNSGKTTLLCELLRAFPGWEAIKVTRGHYRSCGRDPQACCVSPLLGDAPLVRTGRAETYVPGKDTGRYWDAGAANVHWVIATDAQIEEGIARALARVAAPGVFVEGNSYLRFVEVDFALLVTRGGGQKPKPSARRALSQLSAVYLSGAVDASDETSVNAIRKQLAAFGAAEDTPLYAPPTLAQLSARIRGIHEGALRPRGVSGAATRDEAASA
jgi:molybdopterin-guanine dinucleotide biosynthesis protein